MTRRTYAPLEAYRHKILPLRQQNDIRNGWLQQRLETVLPEVMARAGLDMWLVIAREYNEDPVIMSLLPQPAMSARRRTILVFARRADGGIDRLTISRYGIPGFYESGWNPEREGQYECLARTIREYDPQSIGINTSQVTAFADGLSHTEAENLIGALGAEYAERLVSAEAVAVGWLERRIAPEMSVYPSIVEIGHAIIARAFSGYVITPNITTTHDVIWWMRQTMHDIGLSAWFHPTCELQAPGEPFNALQDKDSMRTVIQPGDLLHCDMGFYYLGLATDQQQHAYVLRRGETDAPEGLKAVLKQGNALQDIVNANLTVGRTGNEVLKASLAQGREAGIAPHIYCHPLGYHGHAAGPTIGLWDQQDGVPGAGDYPVYDDTAYSNELNVTAPVAEWDDQIVRIALEEDILLTGGRVYWLDGRQEAFHII
ncbi:MAG: M24 family metallopeptidase [Anaerolineaceae bacterium]|nr:MAG: M24 family metallopeptidase [Anaerolineaceae bacterium]